VQARARTLRAAAVERKAVGGGEQELEEHEQVEDVTGEERAVQAGEEKVRERMEMRPRAVPAREREEERGEREDRGEEPPE
jgi:hypothetical protein